jgi:hypothetical protein
VSAGGDDLFGGGFLAVRGVGGDQAAGQVQAGDLGA